MFLEEIISFSELELNHILKRCPIDLDIKVNSIVSTHTYVCGVLVCACVCMKAQKSRKSNSQASISGGGAQLLKV